MKRIFISSMLLNTIFVSYTLANHDNYTHGNIFLETQNSSHHQPENEEGSVFITGERVIGSTLTAIVNNNNGISQRINYQWFLNGEKLTGKRESILRVTDTYLGGQISLTATYTDFHNYKEEITSDVTSHIATTIVYGKDELATAITSASAGDWVALNSGDWVALNSGDYDAIPELSMSEDLTLTRGEGSTAEISGATCIVMTGDRSALVGLTFNNLNIAVDSTCASTGESAVYMAGLRTTSSQHGGLITNSERASDSGNAVLTPSSITVANSTIINSRQPINFSANDCIEGTFTTHFESNLIANGEDPALDIGGNYGFEGRLANGEGRDAIIDACGLFAESTHNNDHYYSKGLNKNDTFAFHLGSGNIGAKKHITHPHTSLYIYSQINI